MHNQNFYYSNLFAFSQHIKNILDPQLTNPDSPSLIFNSVFLLYKTGHVQPAKFLLETLMLIIEKEGKEITLLEKCYAMLAKIFLHEKQYFKCISILNKSLSINSFNSKTFLLLGKVYRKLNLETQMMDSYFRGIETACDLEIAYELTKELVLISEIISGAELKLFEKFKNIILTKDNQDKFNFNWFIQSIDKKSITIPKVIHRIWLGKNPIPKTYEDYFDGWKKLHPEWSFYTWYDKDIENFINYNKIQEANTYAGKADIARYEILYRHGGVYLDCDIKLLKPLDYLLESSPQKFIVCNEDNSFNIHCSIGFIASVPGFYVLSDAINKIKELDVNSDQPNVSTGPVFFRQCLGYELDEIKLIPTDTFYPYLYNEPIEILNLLDLDSTYGIHVWSGSWKDKKNQDNYQLDLEQLVAAYIKRLQRIKDNIYFVVIGANDGVQNDSLAHFIKNNDWQGIFVEPLPDIFFRLLLNYYQFQYRLKFENSAISGESILTSINRVKPIAVQRGDVPDWAYGIASLHNDRNAIGGYSSGKLLAQRMDNLPHQKILENTMNQEIKCITFQDLVEKYQIIEIDILQIDCEGHDYVVFQQIDFYKFKPFFIKVEICNLTKDEFEFVVNKLISHDYIIYRTTTDLFCFRRLSLSQKSIARTHTDDALEVLNNKFRLKNINLIIFPDWKQPEELLYQDLASVLRSIATHPDQHRITLLIDNSDVSDEDANLLLSGVILNLIQQEDLNVTDESAIFLVGKLSERQWEYLLQRIHACIILSNENQRAITQVGAESLLRLNLEELKTQIMATYA
jgi:FkbM family methyltransferase